VIYTQHIDSNLLEQVAGGNEKAFADLVNPLFDNIYGLALSVTKSHFIAEEVVQDVFLRIWKHKDELPSIENIQGWIFKIARNKALDAFRIQLKDASALRQLDSFFAISYGSPEDEILRKESEVLVARAAETLPEQQANVFKLSRIHHLTLDEIAAQLEISKETVKKHLSRSLKTVRAYVEANSNEMLLIYCWFIFNLF
jgi:RNA polymerase sigma-70 factor (family 1)